MTDEYLLERGYKQYEPSPLDDNLVVANFQKRFDDNYGKKYFINVLKWSHDYIPVNHRDKYWTPFSYTYEIYFTMFEGKSLKLDFFSSDWALEEVEEFIENFFNTMKPDYYETWDGC